MPCSLQHIKRSLYPITSSATRRIGLSVLAVFLLSFSAFATYRLVTPAPAAVVSTTIVISQVYGAGGNTGATLRNDYVELFNLSSSPVSLNGMSLQYASNSGNFASSTSNLFALPNVTLQPGQYFLFAGNSGGANGAVLPTPDGSASGFSMAAASGKVALVNSTTALNCGATATTCTSAQLALIVDAVAFGSQTGSYTGEGGTQTPTLSATLAAFRAMNGCTDTDSNSADFSTGAPAPRNTASPLSPCTVSATPTLSINDVTKVEGDAGTTTFSFTVGLSAPAGAGGVTFNIATQDNTATTANNDYVSRSLTGQSIASGNNSYTFDVTVNGDTTTEANETFFVNVTSVVGATVQDGQGLGTITNDDVTLTKINQIQGSGTTSPLVGANVSTRGIVTGLKSNGFFIQEPDASVDADPNTSEGIFVFTSSAPPAAATIGNLVQVTATVVEFIPTSDPLQPPLTELSTPTVLQISTGNPLPTPVVLTATDTGTGGVNSGNIENLEKYESMRVRVNSLTVIAPTDGSVSETNATGSSNGVFYGVITGVARPFREAGIQANDPPPAGGGTIPPLPRFDANPERIRVDSDAQPGATQLNVSSGALVTNLVGPLDYGFRAYSILPDAATTPTVTGGTTARAVSTSGTREFTVAGYNLQRFFDTVNDPGIGEPVLTTTAFNNRLNKASLGIRDFLKTPDILGVVEVENLSTLQSLANKINSDAVANSQPNPNYIAFLVEGNDVGGIDVGFLIKSSVVSGSTPRVTVNSVTQEGLSTLFTNPDNSTELLNDRPPLRLDAVVNDASGATFPITVIVVHQRSLNGIDDAGAGQNGWTTAGARVRAKRQAQAVFLANLIQTRQTNNPSERIVVLGDFNAFEVNDGFGDIMGTVQGTPAPDNQTVVPGDGTVLVTPSLTNLLSTETLLERYSYTFDGNAQTLDHAIANQALLNAAVAYRLEHPRINADFPETARTDSTTATRLSDHDPLVIFITMAAPPDLTISKSHTGNFVIGTTGQYAITVGNKAAAGPTTGTITVTDTLPGNLTLASFSGANWSCTGTGTANVSCTYNATLAANATSSTLTLTVNVGAGTPTSVTNIANVSTPGEVNTNDNSASDVTTVSCASITITPATLPGAIRGVAYNQPLTVTSTSGTTSFTLSVTGNVPPGLSFPPSPVTTNFALSGLPTTPGDFTFTVRATDANGCFGERTYTMSVYAPPTAQISDPLNCTGPGNTVSVTATVTNSSQSTQSSNFTATLVPDLKAVPGSCTASTGTCTVTNASTVNWSGSLSAGQTVTIKYLAQVNDGVPVGTQVCATSVATVGDSRPATVTACNTVNCPAVGPGNLPRANTPLNDQKAGSVLIYNVYTSSSTNANSQNTRIAITNTNPALPALVHLFFVDGTSCSIADSYICLTANQTATFLASDLDPGTTGYLVAVAVNATGCPTNFNYLIGDEYVKFSTGHAANLGAQAISALAGGLPLCDNNSTTATLAFDGISYNVLPRVLAVDNIPSKADGNDTLLVLNRIGGNLATGASTLGTLFGLLYDDAENALSFSVNGGCQLRGNLSNTFPRTAPRFEQFIPAGRSGWLRIYSQSDVAITGAAINFNANASAQANAFNQGHNLHVLTNTAAATYNIPVFPPSC
ncbi:MAG: lamin tail domain-containing protein [Acidobacteria bacterium]|nr:lamin tail domain-containing protein [Acidobacteriota bacterium]